MLALKKAYTELILNRRRLEDWTARRKGYLNSWDFYHGGEYVGNVTVLSNGMLSIKPR